MQLEVENEVVQWSSNWIHAYYHDRLHNVKTEVNKLASTRWQFLVKTATAYEQIYIEESIYN